MSSENHPALMTNSDTAKPLGAWHAFIIIICFWVSQKLTLYIILVLGGIITELSGTSSSPETLEIEFQRINYLAHCVSYMIAALTVVTITKRFVGGDTFGSFPEGIGWALGTRFQLFLASITGGLLAIGITLLSIAFPSENLIGVGGNFDPMVNDGGGFRIMWAIMVIAFFPIFEEFLYRGVLFFLIEKSWGRQMAGITASILFFLQHFFKIINSFPVFVAIILLSILTLAFRLKTQSLGPSIALHMTYNILISFLSFLVHKII